MMTFWVDFVKVCAQRFRLHLEYLDMTIDQVDVWIPKKIWFHFARVCAL